MKNSTLTDLFSSLSPDRHLAVNMLGEVSGEDGVVAGAEVSLQKVS
jgi:hypothetical protein